MTLNSKHDVKVDQLNTVIQSFATKSDNRFSQGGGIIFTTDENNNLSATKNGSAVKFPGGGSSSTWETYTLLATGWNNDVYDLSSDYPNAQYDIINIQPVSTTTSAMRTAWLKADCGGHETTNVITAHGTVPTIDIIIGLCVSPRG